MPDALMAAASPDRTSVSPPHSGAAGAATVLAFDFGLARIGVAVGDARLRTVHPLPAVHVAGDAGRFAAIGELLAEWQPARLVVGVPFADAGAEHPTARRAERFARRLEGRFRLPVTRIDERLSSVEAEGRLREAAGARRAAKLSRDRRLDSYAAQVLLEQFFSEAPQ